MKIVRRKLGYSYYNSKSVIKSSKIASVLINNRISLRLIKL